MTIKPKIRKPPVAKRAAPKAATKQAPGDQLEIRRVCGLIRRAIDRAQFSEAIGMPRA